MLKSLHFMMLSYDMSKNPGQWRPGAICVVSTRTRDRVYAAPDRELIEPLVRQLCDYIAAPHHPTLLVKAAMVHLNLTLIHPFSDGNGRTARAMQTLILALDGMIHPVFSSIEEWLGIHTDEYYAVLADTARGTWSPANSAHGWIRFCLKAHYQQGATHLRRNDEYELLYRGIEEIVAARRLNDRMALPLFDAALGMTLTNARYQDDVEVNADAARRDLRTLSESGLLESRGVTKARRYHPGPELLALRKTVRMDRKLRDPYDIVRERAASLAEPSLPL